MYLVDTDVISETSPRKSDRAEVLDWLSRHRSDLYLSVITVAEIRRGVAFLEGMGHRRKAAVLDSWASGLVDAFADRILALDQATAVRAGTLFGLVEARGHQPGLADACIAAMAEARGLIVITRNIRHFRLFGVPFDTPVASDRNP